MNDLKFRVAPGAADSGLVFTLLSDTDEILLAGGPFADRDACLAAIQNAAEALTEEKRYAIDADAAGTFLQLNNSDGAPLARSASLPSRADAENLLERLGEAEQGDYAIELPATNGAEVSTLVSFSGPPRPVSADDYDFIYVSASGLPGFEDFQNPRDGRYYFHFNDAQGKALLYSWGFSAAGTRNQRRKAVSLGAINESRIAWREEAGFYFFIIKARNGLEIARSRSFASQAEGEAEALWLRGAIAADAAKSKKRSGVRKRGSARFDFGLVSLMGTAGFEMLRHATDRLHYFLFNDEDGSTLLYSPGYKTAASRDLAVKTLVRLGANPARYDIGEGKDGAYFVIRAGNQQAVAHSRGFVSAEEAQAAMLRVQRQISALAEAFGVLTETAAAAQGERLLIHVARDAAEETPLPETAAPPEVPIPETWKPAAEKAPLPAGLAAAIASAFPTRAALAEAARPAAEIVPPAPSPELAPLPMAEAPASATPVIAAPVEIPHVAPIPAAPPESSAPVLPEPILSPAPKPTPAPAAKSAAPPVVPTPTQSGGSGRRLWPVPLILLMAVVIFFLLNRNHLTHTPDNAPKGKPTLAAKDSKIPASKAGTGSNALPPPDAKTAAASDSPAKDAPPPAAPAVKTAAKDKAATGNVGRKIAGLHLPPHSMEAALAAYLAEGGAPDPARTFTMEKLVYPPDSHEVNPEGKEEIMALVRTLKAFPNAKIEIQGSTDGQESEHYTGPKPRLNYTLSKLRADCICRRLEHQGISPDRIAIKGNGAAPASASTDPAARQRNRRTDIIVTQR